MTLKQKEDPSRLNPFFLSHYTYNHGLLPPLGHAKHQVLLQSQTTIDL